MLYSVGRRLLVGSKNVAMCVPMEGDTLIGSEEQKQFRYTVEILMSSISHSMPDLANAIGVLTKIICHA